MEDTNIGGYDIPKGTRLFISVWSVHQNEEWYPEPTVFKPERWDDNGDEDKKRPAYAWLPFGLGPHKCIGNFISFTSSHSMITYLVTVTVSHRIQVCNGRVMCCLDNDLSTIYISSTSTYFDTIKIVSTKYTNCQGRYTLYRSSTKYAQPDDISSINIKLRSFLPHFNHLPLINH
jgi:hypothetical protein